MKVKMSFANISFGKLSAVAVTGAFSVLAMSMLERKMSRDKLLKSEPVLKSMDILHGYTYSQSIFGKDFQAELVNINHPFYDNDDKKLKLPIQFRGDKKCGMLYSYCSSVRDETDNNITGWRVDQLDLEIPSTERRWTFYVDPNFKQQISSNTNTKDIKTELNSG